MHRPWFVAFISRPPSSEVRGDLAFKFAGGHKISERGKDALNMWQHGADDEASDLPEPQIAVFAEGLVVSRASLKSLMKDKREEENTFCPKSVFHFAWPVLDFVTVDRCTHPMTPVERVLWSEQGKPSLFSFCAPSLIPSLTSTHQLLHQCSLLCKVSSTTANPPP